VALTSKFTHEGGLTLNCKAYLSPEVNAFATPDGRIRVYSGLMDVMSDDELRGGTGHEIGHTKLGHSVSSMKKALLVFAGGKGAAASGSGAVSVIAGSELGAIAESVLNAQFSQSDETASDDYGFNFMTKHKFPHVHAHFGQQHHRPGNGQGLKHAGRPPGRGGIAGRPDAGRRPRPGQDLAEDERQAF